MGALEDNDALRSCTEEDITVLLETFLVHARIEKVVLCSGTLMLYYSGDRN